MNRINMRKSLIITLVIFLGIGFAYLSTNLTINGIIGYSKGTWNIYFANIEVAENSVEATTPVVENNTTINLDCTFKEPSEFYEFSVDIINAGTIDAVLDELLKTGITSENEDYLSLTVTYYNGDAISSNDLLRMGTSTRIKVRVEYIYDIDELPSPTEISLSISANYKNVDLKEVSYDRNVWNYDYLGAEQLFIVPKTGTYQLETWGAQGGSYNEEYIGGYGGYSTGKITFTTGDTLYINVGGQGTTGLAATNETYKRGGYNGGGNSSGFYTYGAVFWSSGGGGATHIANLSGLLSTLESKVNNIIIVSGGGGGNGYTDRGACINSTVISSGGGFSGVKGGIDSGVAGKQSYGYAFGQGQSCSNSGVCDGGGGGFYGGFKGYSNAGGGSGYIGNSLLSEKSMYCYECEESIEESTKTISTTNVSVQPITNYAKKGNGYARITLIN